MTEELTVTASRAQLGSSKGTASPRAALARRSYELLYNDSETARELSTFTSSEQLQGILTWTPGRWASPCQASASGEGNHLTRKGFGSSEAPSFPFVGGADSVSPGSPDLRQRGPAPSRTHGCSVPSAWGGNVRGRLFPKPVTTQHASAAHGTPCRSGHRPRPSAPGQPDVT